jgi:opacity protein-like surface antigen
MASANLPFWLINASFARSHRSKASASGRDRAPASSSRWRTALGTIRGRLGYAYDRLLIYGTGGFAYGAIEHSASLDVPGLGALANANLKTTEIGFAYGGGIEYALPLDVFLHLTNTSAVTLKAEYLRYDLGETSANFAISGGCPIDQTPRRRQHRSDRGQL